jgi:hypothetical protein
MSGDGRLLSLMLFFKEAALDLLASWTTIDVPIGGRNELALEISSSYGEENNTDIRSIKRHTFIYFDEL